ncbi:MAG: alkaline phosphatase family protein, partial [Gemmatimonadota bacterium]
MVRQFRAVLAAWFALHAVPLPAQQHPSPPPAPPVRLVVALVVDQMRADYLDRFRADFRGGFARLLREGVFFRNAEQDHAITETAPGHATMMTGRSPASVGIVTNDLGVPDPLSLLLKGTATGASPRRFIGTTLFDWMLAHDSATRVLSVSRK